MDLEDKITKLQLERRDLDNRIHQLDTQRRRNEAEKIAGKCFKGVTKYGSQIYFEYYMVHSDEKGRYRVTHFSSYEHSSTARVEVHSFREMSEEVGHQMAKHDPISFQDFMLAWEETVEAALARFKTTLIKGEHIEPKN